MNPRIGERLEEFEPREVRRILVGHYEMRYEIQAVHDLYAAAVAHTRGSVVLQVSTTKKQLCVREMLPYLSNLPLTASKSVLAWSGQR